MVVRVRERCPHPCHLSWVRVLTLPFLAAALGKVVPAPSLSITVALTLLTG